MHDLTGREEIKKVKRKWTKGKSGAARAPVFLSNLRNVIFHNYLL